MLVSAILFTFLKVFKESLYCFESVIVIVTISELFSSKLLSFIAFTDSMMKVLKAWEEETVQKVVDNPRRI